VIAAELWSFAAMFSSLGTSAFFTFYIFQIRADPRSSAVNSLFCILVLHFPITRDVGDLGDYPIPTVSPW
jgi:hypothetical protein